MPNDPTNSFEEIISLIENARDRAMRKVNEELVSLYYNVGAYLAGKAADSKFGDAYIDEIAAFIAARYPGIKGFNRRGLYRMKQFYEAYCGDEFVSALLTQITWTNHLLILSKAKTSEERHFYLQLCVNEGYTSRELERQLDSAYFERFMLSAEKLQPVPAAHAVKERFLDSYVLEFLDLPERFSELEFQRAILLNLKNFILEIGRDFSFIGEEYRVQVGGDDFYVDLLFYHRGLSCLVAFELKIGKFKPEYLGKMNFYLEALDRDHRKENENPSVGVILCASKDDEIVEYALSRSLSPTLVSEYTLRLPNKALLQEKLRELTVLTGISENND